MRCIGCFAVLTVLLLSHGTATAEEKPLVAPKALVFWVDELADPEPAIRRRAAEVVGRRAECFVPWEISYYGESIEEYVAFREEAIPLLPTLIEVIRSGDAQNALLDDEWNPVAAAITVITALKSDAQSALPELKRIILDKDAGQVTRALCCYAILAAAPEDQPVGPIFIELLESTPIEPIPPEAEELVNTGVGVTVAIYSGVLMTTGHTKCEVPYLIQIAEGKSTPVMRATAVGILGQFDFDAKAAVPALRRLLNDKEKLVRLWAAQSLILIDKDEKRIPEIVNALNLDQQERTELETGFKENLSQLNSERKKWGELAGEDGVDEETLHEFVMMLNHGSGYFRRLAIQTLGDIGPRAKSTIPELRRALDAPDEDTRRMAREALERIQP